MAGERVRVLVLGAGLTGLSASLHLTRAGVAHRLFEREAVAGGHAVTIEEQGFRFDRTGHLLHLRDASMRALATELLPAERYRKIQRKSAVFSHGVYTRYPFQSNFYGLPPEVAYECLSGFLSAHFAKDKPEPQSFEEFCQVHFGSGVSRHFMLPYNSRLWGVPPSEITSEWCQRFVPLPQLSDVLRGAVGAQAPELGYNVDFWYPELGMGSFAAALAERTPVELSRAPLRIDRQRRELVFENETLPFEALVSSIPLPKLLGLLAPLPAPVAEAAARLRSTHLHYLDLGLRGPNPNPYHWIYVPEAKYPFYRVGCYSHFSDRLAPPGKSSLYVELVDRRTPNLERALSEVVPGLVELGLVRSESDIELSRLRTIEHAYVIYDHHYRAALDVIEPFLVAERIVSSGRYGAWNYSSMEDALLMGRDAAARARGLLSA
ncbi:MAG TPA: FAD-dependent oxidoreductase [Polyangiaceae bacterium]|nr:FAD-dependent oxidoreductase [Polyangiaceae bacterium]